MNEELVETLAPKGLERWRPWRARITGICIGATVLMLAAFIFGLFDAAGDFEWLFALGYFVSIAITFVAIASERTMLRPIAKAFPDFTEPALMQPLRAYVLAAHALLAIAGWIAAVDRYGWWLL
jgi:hypothetical protein